MTVTRDVPTSSQNISESQPLLLANSQGYFDTFAVDHVGYNDSGAGYHNKVTTPDQSSDPASVASAGVLYSVKSTTPKGDRSDLYYRYQSGGTSLTGQIFPVNFVKAFGKATPTAGDCKVAETVFNVSSCAYNKTGIATATYTFSLTTAISDDVSKIMIIPCGMGSSGLPIIRTEATSTSTIVLSVRNNASAGPIESLTVAFIAIAI